MAPSARLPSLLATAAVFVLTLEAVVPVSAQTGAPTPLRLDDRQRQGTPALEPAPAPFVSGELLDGRATAVLQNRITVLEEEIRRLTGRVEEAEFREAQTRQRIDQLVADLDRRLAALEQQTVRALDATTAAAAGGAPLEALSAEDAEASRSGVPADRSMTEAERATAAGDATAEPDAAAREGYVLGTIPRDALLGIPQPTGEGSAASAPAAALQGDAAARFSAALELLQTGDYAAAEAAFGRWVADFPDDAQTPAASYWIGEAQLAQGALPDAAATFAANYRTYGGDAPRAADNLLKLGTALAAMGDTSRACQTFAEIDRRYPDASSSLRQALARERSSAGCG
jgi:tol-pal system protein YbgF